MSDALVKTAPIDINDGLMRAWGLLNKRVVTEEGTGCHLFLGAVDKWGYPYPVTVAPGTNRLPHRIAFVVAAQRDIRAGYTVGHSCHDAAALAGECAGGSCRHRRCLNPDHLLEQTMRENTLSTPHTLQSINAGRTHCPAGHELAGDNLIPAALLRGQRACSRCAASRAAETYDLLRRARSATGLSHGEYLKRFGSSRRAALEILAVSA